MDITAPRLRDLTVDQYTANRALDFARLLSAKYQTHGVDSITLDYFKEQFPRSLSIDLITKAQTAPATTIDGTWASPLVTTLKPLQDAFLALSKPASLIGRIPGLRYVPLNVSVAAQAVSGVYAWVGQGGATPITKFGFTLTTLTPAKVSAIIVLSRELLRLAAPGSDVLLRDELIRGVAAFLDRQFVDPTVAAVGVTSPASITNAAVPIASSGPSAANARTDLQALVTAFLTDNANAEGAVLLMSPANALALGLAGLMDIRMDGRGTAYGLRVVTSTALGSTIVLFDPSAVLVHDGDVELDASENATVQMNDAPDNPPDVLTAPTSLFQANLSAVKVLKFASWKVTRATAVHVLTGAAYV